MIRILGLSLVIVGLPSMTSGEEIVRSSGRQTLYDIRRLGTALETWLEDRTQALSKEEQTAMRARADAMRLAEKQAAVGRGDYVDPETLTLEQKLEKANRPHPRGKDFGAAERLTQEQIQVLLKPAGSTPFLESIPVLDGWGRPMEVWGDLDNLLHHTVFAIRSAGANGRFEGLPYGTGGFEPGNEFDDIVWVDGFFYRWPAADARDLEHGPAGTLFGLEAEDDL
jgi:hypothetical protein